MSEITATAPAERTGLSLGQAVAVGINTTSPAYSLAAILAPMAALSAYHRGTANAVIRDQMPFQA